MYVKSIRHYKIFYVSCHESVNEDVKEKMPKIYREGERKWLFYKSLVHKSQGYMTINKIYKRVANTSAHKVSSPCAIKNRKIKSERLFL